MSAEFEHKQSVLQERIYSVDLNIDAHERVLAKLRHEREQLEQQLNALPVLDLEPKHLSRFFRFFEDWKMTAWVVLLILPVLALLATLFLRG